MPSKQSRHILVGLMVLAIGSIGVVRAELATLFTTPQERQIINANRYKNDDPKPVQPVDTESSNMPMQQLLQEEVTREYAISGITVSPEGAHRVWINAEVYEDGGQLEDRSRIKVMVGNEIKVRITAPDGKHYFATSGEALRITYLAPVEN